MNQLEEFRSDLEQTVRAEARWGWDNARSRWDKPLPERIAAGRALGGLRIAGTETVRNRTLVHFHPSREDAALFREEDRVRLSLNDPDGADFISATFLGLTEKGLSVAVPKDADLRARDGWSLDEDHFDLSDFYLRALQELATTAHGRDVVLPALLGDGGDDIDLVAYDGFSDPLGEMDDSQTDALAMCLAAERYHLVQGPPGTGKTHLLARLVKALVDQGQRVLLTAFTHRAMLYMGFTRAGQRLVVLRVGSDGPPGTKSTSC